MNVIGYIKKYGDIVFEKEPFNEIDNIIFSSLAYSEFEGIVNENKNSVVLNDVLDKFLKKYKIKEIKKQGLAQIDSYKIIKAIYNKKRYRDVILYAYRYIADLDKQFSAVTFKYKKEFTYVAFEGTDNLISGWKEDFETSYKFPVPAQEYAIKYLNEIVSIFDKNVYVGGHSKGGNLALVSSMFCNSIKRFKIKRIYNNDGPGLRKKEIESKNYKKIEDRLIHIIPAYSVVGLLLRHSNNYKVIKSSRRDIMAHSLLTWQIEDKNFVSTELSDFSKRLDESIIIWLDKHDDKKRERMINAIFKALDDAKIYNLNDLKSIKKSILVIKNLKNIDKSTKELIIDFLTFNLKYVLNNIENVIE